MDRVKMVARARTESTTSPAPVLQDSQEARVKQVSCLFFQKKTPNIMK